MIAFSVSRRTHEIGASHGFGREARECNRREEILRDVASKASPQKLHAKVRLFQQPSDKILAWIGDNVCHTNTVVSAPITVTVLSDTSASTATGMVGKIKPDQP